MDRYRGSKHKWERGSSRGPTWVTCKSRVDEICGWHDPQFDGRPQGLETGVFYIHNERSSTREGKSGICGVEYLQLPRGGGHCNTGSITSGDLQNDTTSCKQGSLIFDGIFLTHRGADRYLYFAAVLTVRIPRTVNWVRPAKRPDNILHHVVTRISPFDRHGSLQRDEERYNRDIDIINEFG